MDKNICPECHTENESEYVYCKNCGALLKAEEKAAEPPKNTSSEQQSMPNGTPDNIDGVFAEDISAFIGKKANDYIKKFNLMHFRNKKSAWCWPVAILSFFFGPIGAAIWFFYRKMYKWAWIFVLLGAVADVAVFLLSEKQIGSFEQLNGALLTAVSDPELLKLTAGDLLDSGIRLLSAIITGLYSAYIYKRFCVSKIIEYRMRNEDPRYYGLGLSVIGGTSGGMAVLGVVIMFAVESAISYLL